MRLVHWVLLKNIRQQASKTGDIEVCIAEVIAQWVPDRRTNHGKRIA